MTAALVVGLLVAGGVYLVLQPGLIRVTLGFVLIGHALNSLLVAAGGMGFRAVSFIGTSHPDDAADPLPQAFALTAIVITFGVTVYLFGLARAGADDAPDEESES
ncbi:cation:proton antiporter [Actinobacteria bacterium YIM 96077]|uniref:Cation:proton antiporter n=1 Tax=Phytoactinopolyspora halophila TaxID=1981511 RepID=A0A329R1F8_9ACTN|nr:sodium:proton antiporter [Phytoactinopolyspora halophila]AYY11776.1 cation:proton antiporter [Actinobacteria bacterium YIM 96077]RAW17789.1 cation:proton antiporter [Phytoactinopolyspora halophila]